MAKQRLSDEGHMIRFFMTKSGPECELMLSNLKSILANRTDITQAVKKERKRRESKVEAPTLLPGPEHSENKVKA